MTAFRQGEFIGSVVGGACCLLIDVALYEALGLDFAVLVSAGFGGIWWAIRPYFYRRRV